MSDTSTKGPLAMTTDRDDIASCPFCGGEAKLRRLVEKYPAEGEHPAGEYDAWFYVNCDDCGIDVGDEYESSAISMGRVTAAKVLADWLGYSWDGLPDRGSDGFPDWAYDGNGRKRYQGGKEGLLRLLAALDSPPDHGGGEGELLATMAKHLGWELDWGPREPNDEEGEYGWRVHDRRGNRSDLEWTLIGFGASPADALRAALRSQP